MEMGWRWKSVLGILNVLVVVVSAVNMPVTIEGGGEGQNKNAYAAMMYMKTPRDYEYYVALRVMMRSLAKLKVEADRVVIASADVPLSWVLTL